MTSFDCNSVLEQLSEYLDPGAREELCQAIAEHLSRCRDCRVYVDTVKKTIVLYQDGDTTEVPMQATLRLREALAREYQAGASHSD